MNARAALPRVLVVEDEFLIACDVMFALEQAGADVVGPATTVSAAMALLDANLIDAAVLDIDLRGNAVYPVADRLFDRGVPFVFATGYDVAQFDPRYAEIARFEKPFDSRRVAAAVMAMTGSTD